MYTQVEVSMSRSVVILIVGVFCAGAVQAQSRATQSSPWAAAADGTIPPGAVAYGREADGRDQFVCRGVYEAGTHLGRIASGFGGCKIGYGGVEVTLPQYEVLTRPRVRRGEMAAGAIAELLAGNDGERGQAATAAPAAAPSTPEPERGFEADGQPYVITHFPDGTVERRTPHGGTRTKPDGTREVIRQPVFANAPIGTPPELPADPNQGRRWMEMHNMQLLSMIHALVKNSQSEVQKFDEAERKVNSSDLFDQIAYRTKVATFLANGR